MRGGERWRWCAPFSLPGHKVGWRRAKGEGGEDEGGKKIHLHSWPGLGCTDLEKSFGRDI